MTRCHQPYSPVGVSVFSPLAAPSGAESLICASQSSRQLYGELCTSIGRFLTISIWLRLEEAIVYDF